MKVAMLGPLEVRDGAGAVRAVTGTRLRALLILLALRAGQVVPAGSLIDDLWGRELPADAPNALQALVSRLRRALGEPAAVVSGPAGYQLAIGRDDVDVFRFERLAARGHAALAGSPDQAAGLLAPALELWRGEPLSDAAETEAGRAAIARLSELRLTAIEDRIDAELRLGGRSAAQVPQLIAELEGLLSAEPTRETLAVLLMRALTTDGRRAAALQVYERTRELLADELGADPSPRLSALHLELLRADGQPAAAPAKPAGNGNGDGAARGTGGGNLPVALTSFIGREGDLADVGALLREHRLVTLTGPGGAGKTRLAVEAARQADFRSGVWLAELAPVTDPADVPATVLSALGLREQALLVTRQMRAVDDDALDRLIAALSARQALLVLDNCEHLIGAAAALSDRVLARCPGVRILATSREPLNITGEALWPVGPLPRAERLFAERAAAVCPGFELTAENSAAVSRICSDLDGMPLAIELAAARARATTPEQIAERLGQRFRLLTGGSRTALPRHQTLRAVVDWSWDLLGGAERALLRRLSVFTGGATLEAVEQVCATEPVDADDVLDLLAALADKSLVVVRQAADGPRYRLLETIREYGRERLADADEAETMRARHAAHFVRFAERAAPHLFGPEQLDWLRRMGADADNAHLAIRAAVAAGDIETAVGLVGGFGWFWWLRSMKQEGVDLTALVLRHAPTAAQLTTTEAGEDPAALGRLATAYALGGMLAMDSTRYADSVAWLREADEITRRLGPQTDGTSISFVAHVVAALAPPLLVMIESYGRTVPESVDAAAADSFPWVSGLGRVLRGQIILNQGGITERAESDFRIAVATFERLGERWGLAMAVSGLAQVEEWQGDRVSAAARYEQAAGLAEELGTTEDETQFRLHLARVLWRSGGADRERARAEVARALRDAERLGWPEVLSYAYYMAGNLARLDQDYGAARKYLTDAARIAEGFRGGLTQVTAVTMSALGQLDVVDGDLDAARDRLDRALEAALTTGDYPVVGEVLTGMADAALRGGDAARAVALLGAAEGVRGTFNRSDEDGERVGAAARALLSPDDYGAAFQRGRGVTPATLEAALAGFLTSGA